MFRRGSRPPISDLASAPTPPPSPPEEPEPSSKKKKKSAFSKKEKKPKGVSLGFSTNIPAAAEDDEGGAAALSSYREAAALAAKALAKEKEIKPSVKLGGASSSAPPMGGMPPMVIPKLNMAKALHRWDKPPDDGYAIGARVYVKRSNGTEAVAYVAEYDSAQKAYKLNIGCKDSEAYKMCRDNVMRQAPPPTAAEAAAEAAEEARVQAARVAGIELAKREREKAIEADREAKATAALSGLLAEAQPFVADDANLAGLDRAALQKVAAKLRAFVADFGKYAGDGPATLELLEQRAVAAARAHEQAKCAKALTILCAPKHVVLINTTALKAAIENALLVGCPEAAKATAILGQAERAQKLQALVDPKIEPLAIDRAALALLIEQIRATGGDVVNAEARLADANAAHEAIAARAAVESELASICGMPDADVDVAVLSTAIARAIELGIGGLGNAKAKLQAAESSKLLPGQAFAIGKPVFVVRSSGAETAAVVKDYDADKGIYTVSMDEGDGGDVKHKRARAKDLRERKPDAMLASVLATFAPGSPLMPTSPAQRAEEEARKKAAALAQQQRDAMAKAEAALLAALAPAGGAEQAAVDGLNALNLEALDRDALRNAIAEAQRVGAPSVGVAEATLAAADKAAETAARRAELSSRLAFLSKPGVAASEVDRTALKAAIDEARAVGGVSVAFAESRLGQAMLLIKRDSSIKRLAELVAASSDPLTVDREALRAAVEEANAVGADASEAEAKLLAAEQAAAPQFRVFDRCAVAQNDVAQQLSRAYVLSYDEATLSYTCALGRPDAPETRVVHASAMRPFDPEEHYAPPGQEFPMGSQVLVKRASGQEQLAFVLEYVVPPKMNGLAFYKCALGTASSSQKQLVPESNVRLAALPTDHPQSQRTPQPSPLTSPGASSQASSGRASGALARARAAGGGGMGGDGGEGSPSRFSANAVEEVALHEIGARVMVRDASGAETLAFVEAFITATRAYKLSLFTPDSHEYTTAPEGDIRPAPVARFPAGTRVVLRTGGKDDGATGTVEAFDPSSGKYDVALLGDGGGAGGGVVAGLDEAQLVAVPVGGYGVGARVGVLRSSGETAIAFIVSCDPGGGFTCCLDKPGSNAHKKVSSASDLRPILGGYNEGAKVLVKRSSGEETVAYVEAFLPDIGLYRLALFSPDSGESKLAREADLRDAADAKGLLDASVYEQAVDVAYGLNEDAAPAGGKAAQGRGMKMPSWAHSTYVQAPVRDAAPVAPWYMATMKAPARPAAVLEEVDPEFI